MADTTRTFFRPTVNSVSLMPQPQLRGSRAGSSSASPAGSQAARPTSAKSALTGRPVPTAVTTRAASYSPGGLRQVPAGLGAGGSRTAQQSTLGLAGASGASRPSAGPTSPLDTHEELPHTQPPTGGRPGSGRTRHSLFPSAGGGAGAGSACPFAAGGDSSHPPSEAPASAATCHGHAAAHRPSDFAVFSGGDSAKLSPSRRSEPGSSGGSSARSTSVRSPPPPAAGAGGGAVAPSHGRGSPACGASSEPRRDDVIVIHVRDDHRRINRDFYCSRELLLSHMHYFQAYVSGARRYEEIDISVHCDVHIFEWLMEFIHEPTTPPYLDPSSVVSILISADFLQMAALVRICLAFLKQNAAEVVKLPIDLGCLNDELLGALARLFEPDEVERMRDKKDKLASRIYEKKIDVALAAEAAELHRCTYCHKHFTEEQRECEPCAMAPVRVDFHGNAIAEHVANRGWDAAKWVAASRKAKGHCARTLFWKIWALTNFLNCAECGQQFPLAELDHCTFHPDAPLFDEADNCGCYPCCGQPALRFDLSAGRTRGCRARRHTPDLRSRTTRCAAAAHSRLAEVAIAQAELVLIPFEPANPAGSAEAARRAREAEEARSDGGSDSDDEPLALKRGAGGADDSDSENSHGSNSDTESASDSDDGSSSDDDEPATPPASSSRVSASRAEGAGRALGAPAARAAGEAAGETKWHVESQHREDHARFGELARALESGRRDAGPVCRDGPAADKAPSLNGAKAFFLDRRFIMQMTRNGAVSVVWPRSSATATAKRRPSAL